MQRCGDERGAGAARLRGRRRFDGGGRGPDTVAIDHEASAAKTKPSRHGSTRGVNLAPSPHRALAGRSPSRFRRPHPTVGAVVRVKSAPAHHDLTPFAERPVRRAGV